MFNFPAAGTSVCKPNGCPASGGLPAGGPMFYNVLNGKFSQFSYGGLITRGALQGTQFGANGQPSQFDYGFRANGLPPTPARNTTNAINGRSGRRQCLGCDPARHRTGLSAIVDA